MDYDWVAPPGRHPHDPAVARFDVIFWLLDQILGDLDWVREYHAEALAALERPPGGATVGPGGPDPPPAPLDRPTVMNDTVGDQLRHLRQSARDADRSTRRLAELLLAGYRPDAAAVPPGLTRRITAERSAATAATALPPPAPPPPGEPGGPLSAEQLRAGLTREHVARHGDPALWRSSPGSRRSAPKRT